MNDRCPGSLGNGRQSPAISGNFRQSTAIAGNFRPSSAIFGHPRSFPERCVIYSGMILVLFISAYRPSQIGNFRHHSVISVHLPIHSVISVITRWTPSSLGNFRDWGSRRTIVTAFPRTSADLGVRSSLVTAACRRQPPAAQHIHCSRRGSRIEALLRNFAAGIEAFPRRSVVPSRHRFGIFAGATRFICPFSEFLCKDRFPKNLRKSRRGTFQDLLCFARAFPKIFAIFANSVPEFLLVTACRYFYRNFNAEANLRKTRPSLSRN